MTPHVNPSKLVAVALAALGTGTYSIAPNPNLALTSTRNARPETRGWFRNVPVVVIPMYVSHP